MRLRSTTAALVAAIIGGVLSVIGVAGQSTDLWIGTWKLNIAESTYSPGPPPTVKSQIVIHQAVPNGITTIIDAVDAKGARSRREITALFDGREYELKGNPMPTTRIYTRIDNRSFEYVERVNGQLRGSARVVISADGKRRTTTTTRVGPHGEEVRNVEISERQ